MRLLALSIKISSLVMGFMVFGSVTYAQVNEADSVQNTVKEKKDPRSIGERIYFGGNIGFSFGTYTRVSLNPLIGYKFTPKFSGGMAFGYEYVVDKRLPQTYQTHNFGLSFFTRYRIVPQLYAHAEYAWINYELFNSIGESSRETVPFFFVGGGYSQAIGNRTWLNMQVLFDALQDVRSPYKNWDPYITVGVGVGF
ncbi:MAG: hypothetical protein KTR26_06675 [Flammeovirgaceae bacterium]|nr:hypothetical protein [Flammeovirgaceae bacterium]